MAGFIPLELFEYRYKAMESDRNNLLPLIIMVFFSSFYELVFSLILGINAAYWFQFYSLVEIVFVLLYFYKTVQLNKYFTAIIATGLCLIYAISFVFWDIENALISKAINKTGLLVTIIFFTYIWIKRLFAQKIVKNIFKDSEFIVISAIAIYYFSTMFLFILSNFILNSTNYFFDYWMFNIIATLFFRIMLTIGVWKMK